MGNVLVVEDAPEYSLALRALLERAGYAVDCAADGRAALDAFNAAPADLVVLDLGLPVLDGWQTLERLRDVSDVPVMILSASASEFEKVRALQAGADDYQVKPFSTPEFLARVGALLRRVVRDSKPRRYADAHLTVDFATRAVTVDGAAVELTATEFRLLHAFLDHPGEVLTHNDLLKLVWHDAAGTRDQVKTYVRYLRKKLGDGLALEAIRGVGYRFTASPA
jgi:DNA-binding response OmpR family regulator